MSTPRYDDYASTYQELIGSHEGDPYAQALLGVVGTVSGECILDLGCGPGRDLIAFRDLGHVVVGLDGCPEFVAMARTVSGCEVWQQDMLAMTLPSSSFDGVFANAVLFHVPSGALPDVKDEPRRERARLVRHKELHSSVSLRST